MSDQLKRPALSLLLNLHNYCDIQIGTFHSGTDEFNLVESVGADITILTDALDGFTFIVTTDYILREWYDLTREQVEFLVQTHSYFVPDYQQGAYFQGTDDPYVFEVWVRVTKEWLATNSSVIGITPEFIAYPGDESFGMYLLE